MKDVTLFNQWNLLKQQTHAKPNEKLFPKVGEVWFIVWGKNIGFEQNGSDKTFSRPGVVVTKFNNKIFWLAPLTSKQKSLDFYFNFTDPNGGQAAVIVSQMKLISIKRFERFLYKTQVNNFNSIKTIIKRLIN